MMAHYVQIKNIVLNRWKNDFQKLYNKASFTSAANNNVTDNYDTVPMESNMNEKISILEIIKVVKKC